MRKKTILKKWTSVLICMTLFFINSISVYAESSLRAAEVVDFEGSVEIFKVGGEKQFKAFKGMSLAEGDRIITGESSWASLIIDSDKEVKIGDNTSMTISELRGSVEEGSDQTGIELKAGKIWTKIKEKLNVDAKYEIKTPTTVMGVRGTQFFASQDGSDTYIAVLEGKVYTVMQVKTQLPDGTIQEEALETFINENEQITLKDLLALDEEIIAEPIDLNDLDLMVLEDVLENTEERDPEFMDQLTQIIEKKRLEQEEQGQQELDAQQQELQIIIPSPVNSNNTNSGSTSSNPLISLYTIPDIEIEEGNSQELTLTSIPSNTIKTANSSNENVATVAVSGNTLILHGEAPGTSVVTVTASKLGYRSASRQFTVRVTEATIVPSITIESIGDIQINEGHNQALIVTSNPEDTAKSATSSNEQVASVSVSGNTLNIEAVAAGTCTIAVTANKSGYEMATIEFDVLVIEEQPNPTISMDFIDDIELEQGHSLEVPLIYAPTDAQIVVDAYDSEIVDISMLSNGIEIFGKMPGECTITLTASKSGYESVSRSFTVNVYGQMIIEGPDIVHVCERPSIYPSETITLTFTKALNDTSRQAVVYSIKDNIQESGYEQDIDFQWNEAKTILEIHNNACEEGYTFENDVTVVLTDMLENSTERKIMNIGPRGTLLPIIDGNQVYGVMIEFNQPLHEDTLSIENVSDMIYDMNIKDINDANNPCSLYWETYDEQNPVAYIEFSGVEVDSTITVAYFANAVKDTDNNYLTGYADSIVYLNSPIDAEPEPFLTASPDRIEVGASPSDIILEIVNDEIIDNINASDITLGGVFEGLGLSYVYQDGVESQWIHIGFNSGPSMAGTGMIMLAPENLSSGYAASAEIEVYNPLIITYTVLLNELIPPVWASTFVENVLDIGIGGGIRLPDSNNDIIDFIKVESNPDSNNNEFTTVEELEALIGDPWYADYYMQELFIEWKEPGTTGNDKVVETYFENYHFSDPSSTIFLDVEDLPDDTVVRLIGEGIDSNTYSFRRAEDGDFNSNEELAGLIIDSTQDMWKAIYEANSNKVILTRIYFDNDDIFVPGSVEVVKTQRTTGGIDGQEGSVKMTFNSPVYVNGVSASEYDANGIYQVTVERLGYPVDVNALWSLDSTELEILFDNEETGLMDGDIIEEIVFVDWDNQKEHTFCDENGNALNILNSIDVEINFE